MDRPECLFLQLDPRFHYNEGSVIDSNVYRCLTIRYLINSTKAGLFAGQYTQRPDKDLYEAAEIDYVEPYTGKDPDKILEYKRTVVGLIDRLIQSGKFNFLKKIVLVEEEPSPEDKEKWINYFVMHDKNFRLEIDKRIVEAVMLKKKKKEEELMKAQKIWD